MTSDALVLVGRRTARASEVFETHAGRLEDRGLVDRVHTATYESEPVGELREQFGAMDADQVFVVPMCAAHTFRTLDDLPAALSAVPGEVRYCEPLGTSPAVTDVLTSKAASLVPAAEDASLVLVGFGSSSKPHNREALDYHATRIRDESAYGEVLTCFLLQNPTVECVRYNVTTSQAVAVPVFVTESEATSQQIPQKLELDRGGIEYADPLAEEPRLTDAIHAEVEKQRALATEGSVDAGPTDAGRPVATDGNGRAQ